jgi:hypothetical protein
MVLTLLLRPAITAAGFPPGAAPVPAEWHFEITGLAR